MFGSWSSTTCFQFLAFAETDMNNACPHRNTETLGYTNRPGWQVWCGDCRRYLEMHDPALGFYWHDAGAIFYRPNGAKPHPNQPEQPPMPDLLSGWLKQNPPAPETVKAEQLALQLF